MEQNFNIFSNADIEKAMRLSKTDAAQKLLRVLQSQSGPQLHSAMSQAASGDISAAGDILRNLMQDPEAKALLRRLQEE